MKMDWIEIEMNWTTSGLGKAAAISPGSHARCGLFKVELLLNKQVEIGGAAIELKGINLKNDQPRTHGTDPLLRSHACEWHAMACGIGPIAMNGAPAKARCGLGF